MSQTSAREHRKNARAQLLAAAGITKEALLGEERSASAITSLPPAAQPGTLYVYDSALRLWDEYVQNRAAIMWC
jgi:hypothetical protein